MDLTERARLRCGHPGLHRLFFWQTARPASQRREPTMSQRAQRYFDDLVVGEILESGTHQVTLDELLTFARQYDPQYFHTDPQAAKDSIFGEVIASGIYSMALWRRLDHQVSGSIAWIC